MSGDTGASDAGRGRRLLQPSGKAVKGTESPLTVELHRAADDSLVVALGGALDIASEHHLGQVMESLRHESHRHVTIDLGDLEFLDSRGLSVLLRISRDWQERGQDIRFGPPRHPAVRGVLDVSGADDELPFSAGMA